MAGSSDDASAASGCFYFGIGRGKNRLVCLSVPFEGTGTKLSTKPQSGFCMDPADRLLSAHRASGRFFRASGLRSFVLEQGTGEAVLCLHGVPTSSFVYRKLLPSLAERGLRGLAFDWPGLGLADRPAAFDYSWSGLGRWGVAAVEALGLKHFHLVLHDIGGPLGLEIASALPDRIASLTLLNTLVAEVHRYVKPLAMRPFEYRPLGEILIQGMHPFVWWWLMRRQGLYHRAVFTYAEAQAYVRLLKREDGGRAFLRIMRGFETRPAKDEQYRQALQGLAAPKQILWGRYDPTLRLDRLGYPTQRWSGIERFCLLPGKHFVPEDTPEAIAQRVLEIISH
jgi:pimeloyl-ACP methyl ester carboxylesterase